MAAGLTAADVLMPKAAPKGLQQLELETNLTGVIASRGVSGLRGGK